MIVLIDANSLLTDPMCNGAVWQVLAHAPASWGLQLRTSEAAVAEAVAGYGRSITGALLALDKVSKSWGRLGADSAAEVARDNLLGRLTTYADELSNSLRDVGVVILPVPSVSHMQLVERAVQRRRPCDDKGDGYRDTLFWFTVLEAASGQDEQPVVLVTADSDFLDADGTGLHEHLLEDLAAIGAEGRVSQCASLSDLVLNLADRQDEEGDVKALRGELKDETVRRFVVSLADQAVGEALGLRRCALPPTAIEASLESLHDVGRVSYNVRGGAVASGEAIADFTMEAVATVLVRVPAGTLLDEAGGYEPLAQTSETSLFVITKPLVFSGLLQLGRYDRPLGGQMTKIEAHADDPGRDAWRKRIFSPATSAFLAGLDVNPMREAMKSFDVMKNINANPLRDAMKSFDIMKDINLNPMFDAMRDLRVSSFGEATDDHHGDSDDVPPDAVTPVDAEAPKPPDDGDESRTPPQPDEQ